MKNWIMARAIEQALGILLIPLVWIVILLGIALCILAGLVFSLLLIVAPGQVKVNGIKLYRLTRRK